MPTSRNRAFRWVLVALRVILGAVFIYGGYVKLREPWALFAMSIDSYHLVPFALIEPMARTLPWIEAGLGVWLITGIWLRVSSSIISAMLVGFMVAMVHAKMSGQQINCGCFGPNEPISVWTFLRDGALLASSLFVSFMAFKDARRKV